MEVGLECMHLSEYTVRSLHGEVSSKFAIARIFKYTWIELAWLKGRSDYTRFCFNIVVHSRSLQITQVLQHFCANEHCTAIFLFAFPLSTQFIYRHYMYNFFGESILALNWKCSSIKIKSYTDKKNGSK